MALMRRLLSGSPGTIAGPLSPPLSSAARESSRRPLFAFLGPWHLTQCSMKMGRTLASKKASLGATCPEAAAVNARMGHILDPRSENQHWGGSIIGLACQEVHPRGPSQPPRKEQAKNLTARKSKQGPSP